MKGLLVTSPNINELRFTFASNESLLKFCNSLDEKFPGINYHITNAVSCIISRKNVPTSLIGDITNLAKDTN